MNKQNFTIGVILNFASIGLMAWGPVVNKFALGHIDSMTAALLSALFAAFFSYIYSKLSKNKISFPKGKIIFLISLFNGLGILSLFFAQRFLNPMVIGFMGRFYTVFTTLLSFLVLKEKVSKIEFGILSIAVMSTFLLNYKNVDSSPWLGLALILIQTLLFALVNLLVKIHMKNSDSNSILFYNNLMSAIVIGIFVLLNNSPIHVDLKGVNWILISAFISNFLGLLFFYKGLHYIGFAEANLIRATSPILTAAYSCFFFPIQLSKINMMGAFVLVLSIFSLGYAKLQIKTTMNSQ